MFRYSKASNLCFGFLIGLFVQNDLSVEYNSILNHGCTAFMISNIDHPTGIFSRRKSSFVIEKWFGDNHFTGKKHPLHLGLDPKQGSNTRRKRRNKPTSRQKGNVKAESTDDERTVVILYFKPSNVITSHSSTDQISSQPKRTVTASNNTLDQDQNNYSRLTVYDDVMSLKGFVGSSKFEDPTFIDKYPISFTEVTGIQSKLHAVGRLDADTTGLLLLTNDGGLVHHVTNPTASSNENSKVLKTYEALIMGHHTLSDNYDMESDSMLQRMKKYGIDIGPKYGGWTQPPNKLEVLSHPTNKSTLVQIAISEGRNRQIRRMFHAVQSGVMQLHRSAIGYTDFELNLDGLAEGQWRVLSDEEIQTCLGWKVRQLQNNVVHKGKQKYPERKKRKFRQQQKHSN